MNIISWLFFAWIAAFFGLNDLFIEGMEELFNKKVTNTSYYFIFFIAGFICDLICSPIYEILKTKKNKKNNS